MTVHSEKPIKMSFPHLLHLEPLVPTALYFIHLVNWLETIVSTDTSLI